MDVSQYLEIFIDESKEHLQSLNTCLLALESKPSDKDLINEVFRSAHTLKGMAATMGFKRMNQLTHDMENVLSEIRLGNMAIDANLLDTMFKCLDALEQYVESIVQTGNEGEKEYKAIIDALNAALNGDKKSANATTKAEATVSQDTKTDEIVNERKHQALVFTDFERHAVVQAKKENLKSFGITIYLSEGCVLKSARAFIIFRTLEKLGSIIKSDPAVQDIEDEKFDFDFSVVVVSSEGEDKFKHDLGNIAEVEKVLIDEVDLETAITAPVSDEDDLKDEEEDQQKGRTKDTDSKSANKPVTNRTVRVDIERLDTLMNLVSELIIIKNGLLTVENTNTNFSEQIEYLERITTNLHDAVMKVRMVPIERVFNRFPRLIRDLSRKLNKQMVLHMSGEETELDRTVIDEIGDPLVHLIRNAGDHGLETPDTRVRSGKDATGNVYLKAYQDGNNVVIEVGEDGAGIDVTKVKNKAINSGAISYDQANTMSDQEIIELLFRPSFSTADKISDVSGRGVGLDVVKTKIEALGGDIEVKTALGKGSTFIIRLPLTLAIIQALMVHLNEEKYAIPLNSIQNIEDVKISDIKYIQGSEVINLRGRVIPIIRLHDKLDLQAQNENKTSITVVIVNKGDKLAGFVVDSLIGQQEIVIKTLGKYLTNLKMIAGATILGDGEVALILDVNSLV
ncbi:chemotactic two-component sensor histidine kinase [Petrocella atlantisensis]|uniref:Chemotaxis protein CheA n=1 Tax=Petrocella atlantisensis TaxID=2173034 RepID=A0A3P7PBN1_9FIRM|nr:chemotaxis protein CheA [Petrocella atlantisensis]VDN46298.1 chemotactic two-component sensor histidine kinase [Petrocella atlantisensis]